MNDDLRPIGSGLERLLSDLGMPEHFDMARVVEEWSDVAGEPFATLSHPAAYGGGELVLNVSDGATASLLKFRISDLVERLATRYGRGNVTSVRIRVSRGKKGL